MPVSEGRVPGELGFRRGHEPLALGHVVDVADGVAAALEERGYDDLRVDGAAEALLERVQLRRKMAAQRRVAAARHGEIGAGRAAAAAERLAATARTRAAASGAGRLRVLVST